MYTCSSVSNADKFELTQADLQAKINTTSPISVMVVNGKTYYGSGITNDKNVYHNNRRLCTGFRKNSDWQSSIGADGSTQATVAAAVKGSAATNTEVKMVFWHQEGQRTDSRSVDFSLHVGADADMTNKIAVKIDSLDTKGLGIQGLKRKGSEWCSSYIRNRRNRGRSSKDFCSAFITRCSTEQIRPHNQQLG